MTLREQALRYEKTGEYGRAFALLEQCFAEDGHDRGDLSFHCGWCLENDPNGDRNQAVRFYEKAAAEAASVPVRVNGAFRAGWVLLQEKEQVKAAAAFRRAIDLAEEAHLDHDLYHHALFWNAVCLEHQGRYLDAARQYGAVQRLSAALALESAYREIVCCNSVGRFEAALEACRAFPRRAPEGCDPLRHAELSALVRKEESLLRRCLSEDQSSPEGPR